MARGGGEEPLPVSAPEQEPSSFKAKAPSFGNSYIGELETWVHIMAGLFV